MSQFSFSLFLKKCTPCADKHRWRKLFGVSKGIFLLAILSAFLLNFGGAAELLAVGTTPDAPTGLTSTGSTVNSASMSWSHSGTNITGFKIYRNGSVIATEGANVRSYTDTGLSMGTTYSYYVTAINEVAGGGYPPVSGTTTYNTANTSSALVNYQILYVNADAGDSMSFSSCGAATGDTYLRLFYGGSEIASNDDACSTASEITLTAPSTGTYELHMGCYSSNSCSATVTYNVSNIVAHNTLLGRTLSYTADLLRNLWSLSKSAQAATYESTASGTINITTLASDVIAPTASLTDSVTGSSISSGATVYSNSFQPTVTVSDNVGVTSTTYCKSLSGSCTPNQTNYPASSPIIYDIGYLSINTSSPHAYICYYAQDAAGNRLPAAGSGCADFYRGIAAPSGLSATASGTSVTLTWNDNSIEEWGYQIYYSLNGGSYTYNSARSSSSAETSSTGSMSHTLTGLAEGVYKFQVVGYTGGVSPWSNESNQVTVSSTVAAPTNFVRSAYTGNTITFTWTDNSSDETGFQIANNTEFITGTVGANVTTYTTGTLNCGTSYSFTLKAVKNSIQSTGVNLTTSTRNCDITAPSCTFNPASGVNYSTYNYDVVMTAADPSGVASTAYCTSQSGNCIPTNGNSTNPKTINVNLPNTTICCQAVDSTDNSNTSAVICGNFKLRPTAPNTLDLTASYNGPVTVGWYDTATSETRFDIVRTGPTNASFQRASFSGTGYTSYVDNSCPVGGDYTYTVSACNVDGCSNSITGTVTKYNCDNTAPTGNVVFAGNVGTTNESSISTTINCSDAGSGCASWIIYGATSGCTGTPLAQGTGATGTVSVPLGTPSDTNKTVYAKVTDNVGLTTCASADILYDTTAPAGSLSINSGATTTTTAVVTLNLSCSDNSDNSNLLIYNNTKKHLSFFDKVLSWFGFSPEVQAAAAPGADGARGCRRYDVYNGSSCGVEASTTYGAAPTGGASANVNYTLPTPDGVKNVAVKYTDGAGNTSCATDSITLSTPDNTEPTTPGAPSCQTPNTGNFTCSWTASTDDSGIASYAVYSAGGVFQGSSVTTSYAFSSVVQGSYSYVVVAVDNSSNHNASTASSYSNTVVVDTVAPNLAGLSILGGKTSINYGSLAFVASGSDNSGGTGLSMVRIWKNSTCAGQADLTADYPLSAADTLTLDTTNEGSKDFSGKISDAAGNWSNCKSGSVDYDRTRPYIKSQSTNDSLGRASTTNNNVPVFRVTADDLGAGLDTTGASCEVTIPSLSAQPYPGNFNTSGVCVIDSIDNPKDPNTGKRKQINGTYSVKIINLKDKAGNVIPNNDPTAIVNFEVSNGAPSVTK